MKIVVISDTHLGKAFHPKKYNLLRKIILSSDQVIINGDFWEGYEMNFSAFVRSKWSKLFPLLLSKNTIYIYGNHDKRVYANDDVNKFSVLQSMQYKFKSGSKIFYAEHGDRLAPMWDKYFPKTPWFIIGPLNVVERMMTRSLNKYLLYLFYRRFNNRIKRAIRGRFKKNEYFLCGHVPWAEVNLKEHFINGGFMKHGVAQYLVIEDGRISAKEEWYE